MDKKVEQELVRVLKVHAKAVGIPEGSAKIFIAEAVKAAGRTLAGKKIITEQDLKRAVARELRKYNRDFAYVYEKCDIII